MRSVKLAFVLLLFLVGTSVGGRAAAQDASAGPLSPADALKQFQVPDDLEIQLVLSEPLVRQPVSLSFDERGRLWVVQYIQYPNPAGLKMLSHDKYWRAVYDKVPPPPPHNFRGMDKITIHEDTDGDGVFDKHKTFLDGLNIVTAVARGRGGVWVLNPPYLLFYRDADNDDVPDGDPEVRLAGFGLEDTHSVVNSLRWGPDGWLYAAQGSTVTGNVVRPGIDKEPVHSMGQLIWRYQPETRRYEVFAEGGGNAFGVEIDRKGRIYSGYNGGDTRGFHYVQGGYYLKGFTKHGPLSNPYAFGYFPPMKHNQVQRFTHTFLIYDGGALPERYWGKLFGVAPLLNHVVLSQVEPDGSSFKTHDIGHPVTTTDHWFRPVDIKLGPDGALYIADWYEGQVNHYRNHEGQIDKKRGRIYRLKAKGAPALAPFDLSKRTTAELVQLLDHPNQWFRRTALRLLGDRKDATVVPQLRKVIASNTGQLALEALWAIHLSGGFDEDLALQTLDHADPYVRAWTVRLLCDDKHVSPTVARKLADMARSEPHPEVRSQLACSAKRLPADQCLPIVRSLLARNEDVDDVHLPLLLWWAIESKAETDRDRVLALFDDSAVWDLPMVRKHILARVMRRYASAGTRKDLLTCAALLRASPGPDAAAELMKGFEQAYQGRALVELPDELTRLLARYAGTSLPLQVRLNNPDAVRRALAVIADSSAEKDHRRQLIQVFGEVDQLQSVPVLLTVVRDGQDAELRQSALTALLRYDAAKIGTEVTRVYNNLPDAVKPAAQSLLASRAAWSLDWLRAIDAGRIDPHAVSDDVVRKLRLHRDSRIAELVNKHWGAEQVSPAAVLQQQIAAFDEVINAGSGDPYRGKAIFTETCGKCHTLFGQGGQVGPDLTTYQRSDLDNMLLAVVNPSAEIREGFENHVVITSDGRVLTGVIAEQDKQIVVLHDADGRSVVLRRDEIEEIEPAKQSIMPERLLDAYTPAQVRDLFAYLRSTQPLND